MQKFGKLKIVLIVLVIMCLGIAGYFIFKSKTIVTVAPDGVLKEAEQVNAEIQQLKQEILSMAEQMQKLEKNQKQLQQDRKVYLQLAGAKIQGQHILYYHEKDQILYYIDTNLETIKPIFTVKQPWYILNYDLDIHGKAVWAVKYNSLNKDEQIMRILTQDCASLGSVQQVDQIKPEYWLKENEDIQLEKLCFSPNGEYIVLELTGVEWSYFNVYMANSLAQITNNVGYTKEGGYEHLKFIDFVANSSSLLYTYTDSSDFYEGQTVLYEESMYYNDSGFFRLKNFDSESSFAVDDKLYLRGEKKGEDGIKILKLPALSQDKELSYLYQVRQEYFAPLMLEKSEITQSEIISEENMTNKTVFVRSAKELLEAIGSNRTIHLYPGSYNLTAVESVRNPHVELFPVDDQFEVIIQDVDHLSLVCEGDYLAEFLAEPIYANVLKFYNCNDITIAGIRAGHVKEGYCTGAVLEFEECSNIIIQDSLLYGSGTYGLMLVSVENLQLKNSVITECTYGVMNALWSRDLSFINSRFIRNGDLNMVTFSGNSNASFEQCEFIENQSTSNNGRLFLMESGSKAIVKNSKILNNKLVYLANREDALELENTVLKGNEFKAKYEE